MSIYYSVCTYVESVRLESSRLCPFIPVVREVKIEPDVECVQCIAKMYIAPFIVGIKEGDKLSGPIESIERSIARGARPGVRLLQDLDAIRMLAHQVCQLAMGRHRGTIINDDDREGLDFALAKRRKHAPPKDALFPLEIRYDSGDQTGHVRPIS